MLFEIAGTADDLADFALADHKATREFLDWFDIQLEPDINAQKHVSLSPDWRT